MFLQSKVSILDVRDKICFGEGENSSSMRRFVAAILLLTVYTFDSRYPHWQKLRSLSSSLFLKFQMFYLSDISYSERW